MCIRVTLLTLKALAFLLKETVNNNVSLCMESYYIFSLLINLDDNYFIIKQQTRTHENGSVF